MDALGECGGGEGGVTGGWDLGGEEGRCAVEESYGSSGEACGSAGYVRGEGDREAGVDSGCGGGEGGEGWGWSDREVRGGSGEGVVPCCGTGERSCDGVDSGGREGCGCGGEGGSYGGGVLLEEVGEGRGECWYGLTVEEGAGRDCSGDGPGRDG